MQNKEVELTINLEHCYGIKKLEKVKLRFVKSEAECRAIAVYAQNGTGKTSLAKTFLDVKKGQDSKDRVFEDREFVKEITFDNVDDAEELSKKFHVIESQLSDDILGKEAKRNISTFAADKGLRNQYDAIYSEIRAEQNNLVKLLSCSGLGPKIEETILHDLAHETGKIFLDMLDTVKDEVYECAFAALGDVQYQVIFNDKTKGILEDKDFLQSLDVYIQRYGALLHNSTFFKKCERGAFHHNSAYDVSKNLDKNCFFDVGHGIFIKNEAEESRRYIDSKKDLDDLIDKEKQRILDDANLRKDFEDIDRKLAKNQELKDLREMLQAHHTMLLPELKDQIALKRKLWIAYLYKNKASYDALMTSYGSKKEKLQDIIKQAVSKKDSWDKAINTYNSRFRVPFDLKLTDRANVILGVREPTINFTFKDSGSERQIEYGKLKEVLSSGERRVLYILNAIFEIEARKESGQETLFIVDDIADSFDYRNKYAIVEYLRDIAKDPNFYLLILSHNFDFYRTIVSRFTLVKNKSCFHASKDKDGCLKLVHDTCSVDLFCTWRSVLERKQKPDYEGQYEMIFIASIAFVRNLANYCEQKEQDIKDTLTALLHQKKDKTQSITLADLIAIFESVLGITINHPDKLCSGKEKKEAIVIDLIYELAGSIKSEIEDAIALERKVVLAIAIRLKAELLMVNELGGWQCTEEIKRKKNQTMELFNKYKEKFPTSTKLELLEKVNLMTPECIHINSFMYEPILDMSIWHLTDLYNDLVSIESNSTNAISDEPAKEKLLT